MNKTNVSRLLDASKIEYEMFEYDSTITNGEQVAKLVNQDPNCVFKTLVTIGNDHQNYVFCVPVCASLNLKKAAKSVNVKSIEMIPQKQLLPLTGYIHGGCSPIGMKKPFKTIIDETATLFDKICISAGKVGNQVRLNPIELANYVGAKFEDII